jgi:hypothetical protein
LQEGDLKLAADSARLALALDPENREARQLLADIKSSLSSSEEPAVTRRGASRKY